MTGHTPELLAASQPEQAHHEHHHELIVSKRAQLATLIGNAAIGAAEIGVGVAASVLSVATDGIHNAADTAAYWLQFKNLRDPHLAEQKRLRNRKIANWLIAATSLGVAAKAGIDLGVDHESVESPLSVYIAGASFAFNTMIFAHIFRRIRQRKHGDDTHGLSAGEKDVIKHFTLSDMPSAALAVAGSVAHRMGLADPEQVIAITSGLFSAWVFRPTQANLKGHDHSHGDHTHHHTAHEATRQGWLRRIMPRGQRQTTHDDRWWLWVGNLARQNEDHPLRDWAQRTLGDAPDHIRDKSRQAVAG